MYISVIRICVLITIFFIVSTGVLPYDLSSTVTSPVGITEDAEINEVEDGLYAVHFVPKELGVHTVSVRYKDVHIPGKYIFWRFSRFLGFPNYCYYYQYYCCYRLIIIIN